MTSSFNACSKADRPLARIWSALLMVSVPILTESAIAFVVFIGITLLSEFRKRSVRVP